MCRDEGWRKLDRRPIALSRVLFRCREWFDVTSERGYRLGRDRVEQRLDQELGFSDAARRSEAIEQRSALSGVVLLFWIVRRVFYGLQLAKEPGAVEAGVGKEPRDLSKNLAFLKRRGLVTPLSSHVFQFNRELGGKTSEYIPRA